MGDWDDGVPDALNIQVEVIESNRDNCHHIPQSVVVCNGIYNNVSWRGINEWIFETRRFNNNDNNYLLSSVAIMNDYYINPTLLINSNPPLDDISKKKLENDAQYVMCHELGHAWGLVHTDEDFDNDDTFNCLDYSRNTEDNKRPGQVNYQRLANLYGVFGGNGGGGRHLNDIPTIIIKDTTNDDIKKKQQSKEVSYTSQLRRKIATTTTTIKTKSKTSSFNISDHDDKNIATKKKRQEQQRQQPRRRRRNKRLLSSLDESLLIAMERVYDHQSGLRRQLHEWTTVQQSSNNEIHKVSLSSRHTLWVHKLLA